LTSGPAGSYSYDGAHLDAVTQTSGGYTGSYDDAGDLQCRAPNSSQTCQGTQTGQQMSYDQLRRLLNWQNATNNPTVRAHYAYDGEHERVIQNTGPVTYYLGGYTEVTVNGSSTTTTNYYGAGVSTAVAVNGTITYLVADGIGSASESLSSSGSVQGAQLFAPYGSVRYTTGSMSTTKGFTGQLSDPSGLSYFHARYYDPVVGQFTSADLVQGPNRYAYVAGNPETLTDPTGQYISGGPGSGDSCFVENGKCVTETNGNGADDGTPPTPCNNTDHCLHPVQPGNGVKPPKRDHAAVLLDRQSCLGSFCVDPTLLDALKLHIDTQHWQRPLRTQ
jgi:RHS repeat-associated protein